MVAYILIAILLSVVPRPSLGTPLEYQREIDGSYYSVQSPHESRGSTKHTAVLAVGTWYVCGASIIRPDFLLTAGHCIEPLLDLHKKFLPASQAIVGTDDWKSGGKKLRLKEHYLHPDMDFGLIKNDVALLQLLDIIVPNEKIGIIAMNYNYIHGGADSYITGYQGSAGSNRLQVMNVSTLTHEECLKRVFSAGGPFAPPVHDDVEICTMNYNWDGVGRCNGDAGSALVSQATNQLIGVVSWGFGCMFNAPAMNARMSAFEDFFEGVMKERI